MDYSDKPRRSMGDALRDGKLTEEAEQFVKGRSSRPPEDTPAVLTAETSDSIRIVKSTHFADGNPRESIRSAPGSLADVSVVIPGIVSMTFRLPASLSGRLASVSAERKLKRERPFSQQDIVAEALRLWLHRNGYLDLDRG